MALETIIALTMSTIGSTAALTTAALVGGGVAAGMALSKKSGGGGVSIPSTPQESQQATTTAMPTQEARGSEQAKRNKRLAASLLTKGWGDMGEPMTSKAALLGL